MGRYIRYWYTYRTAVAVILAILLSGVIYFLYTQQLSCDNQSSACTIRLSFHPEDRLFSESTNPNVVIVGIDDQSIKDLGHYPLPRDRYAQALDVLNRDGAAAVAFDIGFSDPRDQATDGVFAQSLAQTKVPVVLGYGSTGELVGSTGQVAMSGIDEIPLREFRCADKSADPNAPCTQPYPNVALGATDVQPDADGVVRKIPLFVEPQCHVDGHCATPVINSLGFAVYRAFTLQGFDGPTLQYSPDGATFGTTWPKPMPVGQNGEALINFSGGPDAYALRHQYVHFSDVVNGNVPADALAGKIVLVGAYYLTGFQDEHLVPTSIGIAQANRVSTGMAGIEIHANVIQMLLSVPPAFLAPEPPLVVFLLILILGLGTALVVARLSVVRGLIATVVAIALFTFGMGALFYFANLVPDLFHPWLAIALTYSGVTAYRFLYEDREKRKVTRLFGHYLKPEIVAQLAKTRGGADDILRGGERRDITLLFVDIRGFTSMSESMAAPDVTELVQMYLDHLSGIIFTWDGTVDKYVGDEIMAFWNAPRMQENHALLAVRCAYDLINRAPELQEKLLAKGLPPIRWGIGVNSGPAVVGNMGSRSRLQYTALGDTVNTAARFCAHAPAFHLLIGQMTYEMCKDYIAVDLVPGVQLKGKSAETFRIYDVTAIRETPTSPWVRFPTDMAAQSHQTFTSQYTQQTVIAAGESGSSDILVGEAAEQALAGQPPSSN